MVGLIFENLDEFFERESGGGRSQASLTEGDCSHLQGGERQMAARKQERKLTELSG
jgi:hypothetical protein